MGFLNIIFSITVSIFICIGYGSCLLYFLKIKDYKNKITWLGSWPILPLYSLNYVLKAGDSAIQSFQADMKQAYQFCYKKAAQNDTD
jgi:hypothetical protein